MTNYVKIACTKDVLRGRMACTRIDGQRFLVANIEGTFYAVSGTCSHEEVSLCSGVLQGELVKCPLHGSRFSVRTGAALEGPADEALTVYPIKVEGNDIFIDLTRSPLG